MLKHQEEYSKYKYLERLELKFSSDMKQVIIEKDSDKSETIQCKLQT